MKYSSCSPSISSGSWSPSHSLSQVSFKYTSVSVSPATLFLVQLPFLSQPTTTDSSLGSLLSSLLSLAFNSPHSVQSDLFVIQIWYVTPDGLHCPIASHDSQDESQMLSLPYKTLHRLAPTCCDSSPCCSPDTPTLPHFLRGATLTSYHRS